MIASILGFLWIVLKGMAFLGGIMVFFAFLGSFYKTFRRSFRDRRKLEKRMEKAWGEDGDKSKRKGR